MLKFYKLRFTEDKENYRNMTVPANNLTEAYIELQNRFPNAEITEWWIEGKEEPKTSTKNEGLEAIAKFLMHDSTVGQINRFVTYLDEEKREELLNAIWDEYHNNKAKMKSKAV